MSTATLPRPVPAERPGTSPGRAAWVGQYGRFLLVGAATTLVYLALYAALRPAVGEQAANALALVLTTDANTAANRRLTFDASRPAGVRRQHAQGWVAFGVSLVLTSGTLAVAEALGLPSGWLSAGLLVTATLVGGLAHFVLLRSWVFRPR